MNTDTDTDTKDLLRFVTCGSVDDGKSTLIGRLLYESKGIYEDQLASVEKASKTVGTTGGDIDLALVTDGLKAEREQGITIDVAYRYFSTPRRKFIIADCPGHEQYTRNMVTGASTAGLAILLVDASKGVIVQTRRHAFLASLLGIRHVVVAVNKMDLVDYDEDVFRRIRQEFTDFAARLSLPDLAFIPMSALAGENVTETSTLMPWYGGVPLLRHLEEVHVGGDRNLIDMRLPVQFVSRPDRTFRGYMGTVASGILRKDDDIVALPSGTKAKVDRILGPGGDEQDNATAGAAVCVTLDREIDVSRGDVIAPVNNVPKVSNKVEAMLVWMAAEPMEVGRQYMVKHACREVPGVVSHLRYRTDVNTLRQHAAEQLDLNEIGRVELELARPIAHDAYRRSRSTGAFIVIDRQTSATVAAGMILDRDTAETSGLYPAEKDRAEDRRQRRRTPPIDGITMDERKTRLGHAPLCVWLTGLKGVGKTSIATALERALFDAGLVGVVLDGGTMREGVSRDLGFTGDDRRENARRAAATAEVVCRGGLFAVCSFISPFVADRAAARQQLADVVGESGFVEIHLDADEATRRDRAPAAYADADSGDTAQFTGVTAPYEAPDNPDLRLDTAAQSVEQSVTEIMNLLRTRGLLQVARGNGE
jgi:bifunctional enzyme CysN/CysC